MNIAAGNIQLVAPVANVIGSLQSAGKLVPRAPKNGCRSARFSSDLEESLANALCNCTELRLLRIPVDRVLPSLLSARPPTPRAPLPSHWKSPSYAAAASFPSPERPAAPSRTPGPPLSQYRSLLMRTLVSPHQLHQRRGFKTQRTVDKERQRLPTLAEKMKEGLQLGRTAPAASDPTSSTKLKELSEQSSTPEESQRLKVAFAEGYVSGGENRAKKGAFTLTNILRLASIGLLVYFIFGAMQANNMFRLQFISNEVVPEEVEVTFDDVRGADEAKQELQDIVAYLRDPDRFSQLGGKLPKGVLLTGPPGTGKTLLARAVAGEANVPFFHASGSEFDEIFVGQGARRVRDLFRTAKARAPCVLFIDEIDSVGGKRSASRHHPYANQTINQLLTEMDGFHSNEGVIVLGATNRRDHLDAALLRPGRFDVEVTVSLPDLPGRKEIFRLYLSKVKVDGDVDVDNLARGAVGFTGADIENIVNQAALRAAMLQATSVGMKHLDWARDKVMMGAERKTRLPDEETNRTTAYHEGGHTLVAFFTKHAHPVHKVTIMPRNRSLGHTSQIPKKDQFQNTRAQLLARLDVLMGGRAAEDIFLGKDSVTTGASDDLKKATDLATAMVKQLGMSDKVGLRTIADHENDNSGTISDSTAELVDAEVKRLLHESYERAKALLVSRSKELNLLAEALLKYETLDAEDIAAIVKGDAIVKP